MTGLLNSESSKRQSHFENDFIVYSIHGIVHQDIRLDFDDVSFRVTDGAPQMRSLRNVWMNLYRKTPQDDARYDRCSIFMNIFVLPLELTGFVDD